MTAAPQNGVSFRLSRLERDVEQLLRRTDVVGELRLMVQNALKEAADCNRNVTNLSQTLDQREEKRRTERRADRVLLVGATLTAAGLVIATLQLLVG